MHQRQLSCSLREVKLAPGDTAEAMTFSGYGAVFGNIDAGGDVIAEGAFSDTLRAVKSGGEWPAMLLQHGGLSAEDKTPIGIWTTLEEDATGLKVSGTLADTPRGREVYGLLKMQPRPAITGLSIGYIPKDWTPRSKPDDPKRTLKKVDLIEVSLVTFPANAKARIASVKSEVTIRDAERALRDIGFSQSESKKILSGGYRSLGSARDALEADGIDSSLNALLKKLTTK